MAYGTRYHIAGKDHKNRDIEITLKQEGFVGLPFLFTLADPGILMDLADVDTPRQYAPVRPFSGSAFVYDNGTITDALTAAGHLEYQVEILLGGVVIFSGFAEPIMHWRDPAAGKLETEAAELPYFVTEIGFVCGLSLLKFFPYADAAGDRYSGLRPIRQVIQECLAPLNHGRDLCYGNEWFVPGMVDGENFLDECQYDASRIVTEDGLVPTCDQVLQDALTSNTLELSQWFLGWVAIQVRQFLGDLIHVDRRDASMMAQTFKNITSIVLSPTQDFQANEGGEIHPVEKAFARTTASFVHGPTPSLIRNPTFAVAQRGYDRSTGDGALYGSDRSSTATRGRYRGSGGNEGRPPRSFAGSITGAVSGEPADYWGEVDIGTAAVTDPTVVIGIGPDGENAARLDPSDAGDGATDALGDWFDDCETYLTTGTPPFSTARKVLGGTGRSIVFRASHKVETDPDLTGLDDVRAQVARYPVYLQFKAVQGATTKWLQNDGSWASSQATIRFGSLDGSTEGIPPNQWVTMLIPSEDLPSGTWYLECRLYNAVDVSPNDALISSFWTNVFADIVVDGVIGPVADLVTVERDSTLDLAVAEYEIRFGTTPILDMPGSTVYGSGTIADDIKVGDEYEEEQPPTGAPIQETVADILQSFQSQALRNLHRQYNKKLTDYFPPYAPVVIKEGSTEIARYRVGAWHYNLGHATQRGVLRLVEELSPTTTITRTPQPGS